MKLRSFFVILVAVAAAAAFAGDIQVTCGSDLRVFLDGKLVGTSNVREDGLHLADVREGSHVVRVEKDGFLPQSFEVLVEKLPVEVKVGEFTPAPPAAREQKAARASVTQATGNLLIISAPQNCSVEIDGRPMLKTVPILRVDGVAAGEHDVAFSRPGFDRISKSVWVDPGADVTVRGDLKTGQVETTQEGQGSIRLITDPEHVVVRFLGKLDEKTSARMNVSHIPTGKHRIEVTWAGRKLATDILIVNGQRAVVTVSFVKGDKPFDVTYEPE